MNWNLKILLTVIVSLIEIYFLSLYLDQKASHMMPFVVGLVLGVNLMILGLGHLLGSRTGETLSGGTAHSESLSNEGIQFDAIARTTAMLAHDVRKPFSMMSALLQTAQNAEGDSGCKDIITKFAPEVDRAMSKLNGTISDFMEAGEVGSVDLKPIDLQELIGKALEEFFSLERDSNIKFHYSFETEKLPLGDRRKLKIVLANLVKNASQALGGSGDLWFEVKDIVKDGTTLIRVDVTNSVGSSEGFDEKHIFDVFYSFGKKGGTGLGLPLAKKIVEDHGGQMRCFVEDGSIKMRFTLLSSDADANYKLEKLPANSSEFSELRASNSDDENSSDEEESIGKLLRESEAANEKLNVLFVDDEMFYLDTLTSLVGSNDLINRVVEYKTASSKFRALELVRQFRPSVVVLDLDLGNDSLEGLAILEEIKAQDPGIYVCIHSNRTSERVRAMAHDLGADQFLPKPMSSKALIGLLAGAINTVSTPKNEFLIIVEDNPLLLEAWRVIDMEQKRFLVPEDFLSEYPTAESLAGCKAIIIDYYFDDVDSTFDGGSLAKRIKEIAPQIPVYLASDGDFRGQPIEEIIVAQVSKSPKEAWKVISE